MTRPEAQMIVIFGATGDLAMPDRANMIVIRVQPDEGIACRRLIAGSGWRRLPSIGGSASIRQPTGRS